MLGQLFGPAGSAQSGRSCPNCGGAIELAGKGVIACPYCGAEVFLSSPTLTADVAGGDIPGR